SIGSSMSGPGTESVSGERILSSERTCQARDAKAEVCGHCALIAQLRFPSASRLIGITMAAILSLLTIRVRHTRLTNSGSVLMARPNQLREKHAMNMIPFQVDPSWYERYWWSDPAPDRTGCRAYKANRERLLRAADAMKV